MSTPIFDLATFTQFNHSSRVVPKWVKGKLPYDFETTPIPLLFSGVVTGEAQTRIIRLQNKGFFPLIIEQVNLVGPSIYSHSVNIPPRLNPGSFLEIAVTFTPVEDGNSEAEITITLAHNLDPVVVPIQGLSGWDNNGLVNEMLDGLWEFIQRSVRPALSGNGPVASLNTSSVNFAGAVLIGQGSNVMSITLTNTGNEDLIIESITASNDFEVIE